MKLSALLAPLIAAKADHATIMDVVLAFEAEQGDALAKRRESDAKRQANKRERDSHVMSRDVTVTVSSHASAAHVEDNLPSKKITENKEGKKETRASHEAAFRAELAPDLPPELLDGIIQVRRDKRGQVTGLAARCFREDAAECGMSVHDAAKACVTSSWITVKPHYFHSRAGPSRQGKRNYADVAMDRANGHGPKSIFSIDGDAERLPAGSRESGPDDGNLRGGIAGRYLPSNH